MYVCICNAIRERDFRAAGRRCPGDAQTVYASLGRTPQCGITYRRATDGKPYRLSASITWKISWQGSGGAHGALPDGTFETTQDMDVQEIQSVNR